MEGIIQWCLESSEPWTRFRTRLDLCGQFEDSAEVQSDREQMLAHPQVKALLSGAAARGETPIKRHNDAGHPIHQLNVLVDFGLRTSDPGMAEIVETIRAHQSSEGAMESLVNIPKAFGGSGEDGWSWMGCDAPLLLYALLGLGMKDDSRVQKAVNHLEGLAAENGFRCCAAPALGKFHGPGSRADPCPIANLYVLKAFSMREDLLDSPAAHSAAEMILQHWESPVDQKYYLFGVGRNFRKIKYPFVWYDILHAADVLSRFPFVRSDPRMKNMVSTLTSQTGPDGRVTASSMYQVWKGWSFADKKNPSPWLTFLVARIQKRMSDEE